MAAEIVNLKKARKEKARADDARQAETNRRRFGRTKAQKAADKDSEARTEREIAGKKLEE